MSVRSRAVKHASAQHASAHRDPPAYEVIADTLRQSIQQRRLPPGLILQEEALASLFGFSRSPVKVALKQLASEKLITRCDGRGVQVGPRSGTPHRRPLTPAMLGLGENSHAPQRRQVWQKIYAMVERELIYRSVFGQFQVNELELARHYGVGRTVAHEVLLRLHSDGIVDKGEKARWQVVPLNSKRLSELYELRKLIEPELAGNATTHVPADTLSEMRRRLRSAIRQYPQVPIEELDALEHDLHVRCLVYANNREMLEALRRTRCILASGKHILGKGLPYPRVDPFLAEHLAVVEALLSRDARLAREAMRKHLESAHAKVEARLQAFRNSYTLTPISFVSPS